jgi:hypothetical protein
MSRCFGNRLVMLVMAAAVSPVMNLSSVRVTGPQTRIA